jgi:hypothetical protein
MCAAVSKTTAAGATAEGTLHRRTLRGEIMGTNNQLTTAEPRLVLPTERISERRFREIAQLCIECGRCPAEEEGLCAFHAQKREIAAMEKQWGSWGIAA